MKTTGKHRHPMDRVVLNMVPAEKKGWGGKRALAQAIGVKDPAITKYWRRVPSAQAIPIEKAQRKALLQQGFGEDEIRERLVDRHKLRPDLYPN